MKGVCSTGKGVSDGAPATGLQHSPPRQPSFPVRYTHVKTKCVSYREIRLRAIRQPIDSNIQLR
jgi:hypothetical protein